MEKEEILQCECCHDWFYDGVVIDYHGRKICEDCYKFIEPYLNQQRGYILKTIKGETARLIYVCSPYGGDVETNTRKARRYCADIIARSLPGYTLIPIAPHLYFTQFLNDNDPRERQIGLNCGIELLKLCDEIWVYGNRFSPGMQSEINYARSNNIPIKYIN